MMHCVRASRQTDIYPTLALPGVLHDALRKGQQTARYLSRVTPTIISELFTPHTYKEKHSDLMNKSQGSYHGSSYPLS